MNSNKLTHVHVYLIGGVLMIIIAAGLFFALIRPLNEENAALASTVQSLEGEQVSFDGGNFVHTQLDPANKKLQEVEARQQRKASRLASLESKLQLPQGQRIVLPETQQAMLTQTLQPWLVLPQVVVSRMQAFSRQLARRHNVKVTTQFAAPAPNTDPNTIPKDIIAWNMGPMLAEGPYDRVMAWARDWNSAPLLVSVDGLKCSLAGENGRVSATSNLTVYIFPTGPGVQKPGGSVAAAPGTGGAVPGVMPGMDSGLAGGNGP